MTENTYFQPNWASPPGNTIADILAERNLSVVEFALRLGYSQEHTHQLLNGNAPITIDVARQLEVILGSSVAFWMTRESQFREDFHRLQTHISRPETKSWLSEFPIKDLVKFGWLGPIRDSNYEAACLLFFGVPSIEAWRVSYRDVLEMAAFRASPSFDQRPGAVAAWLRQGEIESSLIDCQPWDAKRFRAALMKVRSLTREKDPNVFIPELKKLCAECGVAVAIVRAPTGCRSSGATRFLSRQKALLLLSFRYLTDDHFWFTFFHEAGHLLLHGKQALFLEGSTTPAIKEEKEANDFAANLLIPPDYRETLLNLHSDGREVIRFARMLGVSPGIVVGQLQHFGCIKRNQLNNLKRRFVWQAA